MCAEVAECARARRVGVETPRIVGRRPPLLQISPSEVVDLAQLARFDHLPRQSNGRDEPVVEGRHVLDAGRLDALPDLVALVGRAPERLLAEDVLSRLGCGDRRLGVEVVRPTVVEELDVGVADELAPVGHVPLEAVALRRRGDGGPVATRERDEPRPKRRRPRHVVERAVGIRVRLPHERIAEHPDPDRPQLPGASCLLHTDTAGS